MPRKKSPETMPPAALASQGGTLAGIITPDSLIESLPVAALVTDTIGRPLKANGLFLSLFGKDGADFLSTGGRYISFLDSVSRLEAISPENAGALTAGDANAACGVCETRRMPCGKEDVFLSVMRRGIRDADDREVGLFILFRDITEERLAEGRLRSRAFTDALTGLQNRCCFFEQTVKSPRAGDVLVFIDINRFKKLNDVWGHESGDQALKMIARLLSEICPIAVRLGGDEFILYFAKTDEKIVATRLQLLVKGMRNCMKGRFRELSLSMGLAVADGKTDLDTLVASADAAMYVNKQLRAEYFALENEFKHLLLDGHAEPEHMESLRLKLVELQPKVSLYTAYEPGMKLKEKGGAIRKRSRAEKMFR